MKVNIAVLGAGAWGTTLASILSDKKHGVTLWEFNPAQAEKIDKERKLSFFPVLKIPSDITITSNLKNACEGKDYILFAVPSHVLRSAAKQLAQLKLDLSKTYIISAVKGIENGTLKRMSEVLAEELGVKQGDITVLSGPTIAKEVALKMPAAATAASKNLKASKLCQDLFMTPYFRIYTNTDTAGVEAGGALKNVCAIAAGISDGLGMGNNAKSALITRGLRELAKLGIQMGAEPSTMFGLSGLGDLIVTSFSPDSRNRQLGEKLAAGKSVENAEREIIMVAEGVKTAQSAFELAKKFKLELPIINQIYDIIYNHKAPKAALQELMEREAKPELEPDEKAFNGL